VLNAEVFPTEVLLHILVNAFVVESQLMGASYHQAVLRTLQAAVATREIITYKAAAKPQPEWCST